LRFDQEEQRQQEQLADNETQRLRKIIEFSAHRTDRLTARKQIVAALVEKGNMTEIELHKVDEELEEAALERERAQLEIDRLQAKNLEAQFARQRERMKREFQIDELNGRIRVLEHRHDRESKVISQVGGTVVEIRAAAQTAVNVGDAILLIQPVESTSQELEAILYVSAATGKRVEEDMEVHISPSTVKREEYGSMRGTVRFVSDVPTSESAMMAVLNDKQMVEKFTQQIGLPLMATVELITDESTVSGYEWTSSDGPPIKISAGTLCTGAVTVQRQRPIELIVPTVRKKLGMD
jgi:HlyD family secretion protein